MRKLLTFAAATAMMTGVALGQSTPPAASGTDTPTGSSNAAINRTGNAPSSVNASGSINLVAPGALEKGANSFTQGQAQSRIESAGFAAVTDLHQDENGIWRGKATRDGKPVMVGFDYKGNLSSQ